MAMYTIVCSEKAGKEWKTALSALEEKYKQKWPNQVEVLTYNTADGVKTCLPRLTELRPSFTCFFTHHKECSRQFVGEVHRICRQIDLSNPFTDTIWGIMTGLEEEDLLFAIKQEPLVVRRVLGGTPVRLSNFESGCWYSEGEACASFHKQRGEEKDKKVKCPQDTTEILISELSKERNIESDTGVDMMITSGHATENDWQIGYSYSNGKFICMSSNLIGESMDGSLYPIKHNGKPKILSAAGNCLMGHIKTVNCMALAWMHSAGVVQMTGYVVSTWFGFGGWGVHNYFINLPGLMSFSESFYANNQALLAKLHTKYPEYETKDYDECNASVERECAGLLFDRDVVAFYGDPAYDARLVSKPDKYPYHISIKELPTTENQLSDDWSVYEVIVTVNKVPDRPAVYVFPCSVKEYKVLKGENVIINCRFLLVPVTSESEGKELHIIYAIKL